MKMKQGVGIRDGLMRRYGFIFAVAFLAILFFRPDFAHANGLAISNVKLTDRDATADTIKVQFDVTWNNSWKDEINHDAVWIFVKYSQDSGTTWYHATTSFSGTNPTLGTITTQTDKRGVFIAPATYGSGTQTFTSVQITWEYGEDGISDANVIAAASKVNVYGIEMVYIPTGGFYAGDTSSNSTLKQGSSDTTPWFIGSDDAIHVTNVSSGGYYYNSAGNSGENSSGADFWIYQDFPKGYGAFYLMKYEISEGQWVAFFNTLTSAQKTTLDITSSSIGGKNSDSTVYRNTVSWTSGDATTSRASRACSYLSWLDLMAYADWAGMRPMTELEYEKACRGPMNYVSGEKAWGTTSITSCATISGTEDGTETCSTSSAKANTLSSGFGPFSGGDAGNGPLRVGIFATSSTTTRADAGAGYYGNLDLAGNVWERVVTVGNATGRAFVGSHGDGTLATGGYATNSDWPGYSSGTIEGATGAGFRGGAWANGGSYTEISNRAQAAYIVSTRTSDYGGRLARTSS